MVAEKNGNDESGNEARVLEPEAKPDSRKRRGKSLLASLRKRKK
jgi:hypothetical protein